MDKIQGKNTKARINANNRYNAKTYHPFTVNAKISEYEVIDSYCKRLGVSKAQLLIRCALYCIRHGVDVSAMDTSIDGLTDTIPTDTADTDTDTTPSDE